MFVIDGTTPTTGENVLGVYTVDANGYPLVDMSSISTGLSDSIIQLFEQVKVSIYDETCDIQTVNLNLFGVELPEKIILDDNIRVYQGTEKLHVFNNDDYIGTGEYDCHVNVRPGVPFRIMANILGYEAVDITRTVSLGETTSFDIAIVSSISSIQEIDYSIPNRVRITLKQV